MCHYYAHLYSCRHVHYALAKYCPSGGLIQTPCKKRSVWQSIRMGEECEECAVPPGRGNNILDVVEEERAERERERDAKSKSVGVKRKVKRSAR